MLHRARVVFPSSPPSAEPLAAGVRLLEELGLVVDVDPYLDDPSLLVADSDERRARHFTEAWLDPETDLIVAGCGGYGSQRMLDHVDWDRLRNVPPKPFLGSSDATALHSRIRIELRVPSLFGPMCSSSVHLLDDETRASLRAMISGSDSPSIRAAEKQTLVGGAASGVLAGGNLSLLAASIGCPEGTPPLGALVILEDVGEAPYRIDRLLLQLRRSDWFAQTAGILLGDFVDCGDLHEILVDRLADLGVPVCAGFPFGHDTRQVTVPLGVRAHLDADTGTLDILEQPSWSSG